MADARCPIPTPEEQRFLAIQNAAEHTMLEKVAQAIRDATDEVSTNVKNAGLALEPTSEGYFMFSVQQVSFVRLCGGDPTTLRGGNAEIGQHIIRNCRNIVETYWQEPVDDVTAPGDAFLVPTPKPSGRYQPNISTTRKPAMNWEYLTVERTLEITKLNELGADGWELIAVVSPAHFVLHYFFKRKISA